MPALSHVITHACKHSYCAGHVCVCMLADGGESKGVLACIHVRIHNNEACGMPCHM